MSDLYQIVKNSISKICCRVVDAFYSPNLHSYELKQTRSDADIAREVVMIVAGGGFGMTEKEFDKQARETYTFFREYELPDFLK